MDQRARRHPWQRGGRQKTGIPGPLGRNPRRHTNRDRGRPARPRKGTQKRSPPRTRLRPTKNQLGSPCPVRLHIATNRQGPQEEMVTPHRQGRQPRLHVRTLSGRRMAYHVRMPQIPRMESRIPRREKDVGRARQAGLGKKRRGRQRGDIRRHRGFLRPHLQQTEGPRLIKNEGRRPRS